MFSCDKKKIQLPRDRLTGNEMWAIYKYVIKRSHIGVGEGMASREKGQNKV